MARKRRDDNAPTGQPKEPWEFRQERVNKLLEDLRAAVDGDWVVVIGPSTKFDRERLGKMAGPYVAFDGDVSGAEGGVLRCARVVETIGLPEQPGNLPIIEFETDDGEPESDADSTGA